MSEMLPIYKSPENPLEDFVRIPDVTYDDNRLPKKELKASLLKEQGYLCAYCMARISDDTMKVEHWWPQKSDTEGKILSVEEKEKERLLSIDYKNMLAVCMGNEGHPKKEQHCDTQKGNKHLFYNPSNPQDHHKLKIVYLRSGEILSDDAAFCVQLGGKKQGEEGVLNLNCQKLINNRAAVIDAILKALQKLPQQASKGKISAILTKWKEPDSSRKLKEYSGVAIYFLSKRLQKAL